MSAVESDEPALAQPAHPSPSPHLLRLAWKPNTPGDPAAEFAAAIASYLFGSCREVIVETRERELLDDLELDDLVTSIRSGRVKTVAFRTGRIELAGEWQLDLTSSESDPKTRCSLAVTVGDDEQPWTQVEWLQASFDHPTHIPVLAVPRGTDGVSVSVFHGLVVLAARFGQVDLPELERCKGSERGLAIARWYFEDPPEDAVAVIPHEGETLWLATRTPPAAATKPACWVEIVDADTASNLQGPVAPDRTWHDRLSALLSNSPPDGAELVVHLHELAPVLVPFHIGPMSETPPLEAMSPPQDGIVCVLVPTESAVHIGVDFNQADDVVRQALLHAYGHLLLGHVRPGDAYGHWDTAETLGVEYPHRRWDREVREQFSTWFQPADARQVASLDDCTPLEKAQLGLWRMIGEMLGESRRLHALAERYQKAVYQRQAAQRMVAMLEDYGGAMLCDGQAVGPYYLGHHFPTDILLLRLHLTRPVVCATADAPGRSGRPGRTALTSLVEAISLAGSRILQIDEGELAGNWSPALGGDEGEVYMFLYDLLPGGAGYTRLVKDNLERVLDETEALLGGCDCESSCYRCLRHYSNNFDHPSLDRRLALALLHYLKNNQQPELDAGERQKALTSLVELVRLKGLHATQDVPRDRVTIPLVVKRDDGSEVWVDVHHPLVDANVKPSSVRVASEADFVEFCSLDAFTLRHDLPGAYDVLQL